MICIRKHVHLAVHNVVEELPVLRVLHHHEDVVRRLDHLIQLRDRGVPHQFEDVQLASNALDVSDVLYFVLLQNFYSHRLARSVVETLLDLAESALADCLPRLHEKYSMV